MLITSLTPQPQLISTLTNVFSLLTFLGCESKNGTSCEECLENVEVSLDKIVSLSVKFNIIVLILSLYIYFIVHIADWPFLCTLCSLCLLKETDIWVGENREI